jgi:hypothetical protein
MVFLGFGCMETYRTRTIRLISILVICPLIGGCGEPGRTRIAPETELGTTIGSLTNIFALESIPVEGYGVIDKLKGTGSAECPPQIRAYLKQYILAQLPEPEIDIEKFISSRNTAVVRLHGLMPAAVTKNQYFDIRVDALAGTTSLEGGWLYGAELRAAGRFGMATRVLATVKGPVFIDTIDTSGTDERIGYILAGGKSLDEYKMTLELQRPDYLVARRISDVLNTRFVHGTAKPTSPGLIELRVPPEYGGQKQRFISIVKAIYLAETPETAEKRIETFVRGLAVSEDKGASEIALEAIGNESLKKLAVLLNSSNEEVRLRAARCMLNLRSDNGLETLRQIVINKGSARRIEALEAITAAANRNYAAAISRRLLRDGDPNIRLAAYEQLRKMDDISVAQKLIAGNFYLEQIAQAKHKEIFVSRSGQPRIVLFGAPIYCRDSIFVQSANGDITIDARAGQEYVSVIRKHPTRPIPIKLKSSFELSDIIQTLCEKPVVKKDSRVRPGLNVSYADAIAILKQMCESGAVKAQFRAGPLPEID